MTAAQAHIVCLVPAYRPDPAALCRTIASLEAQSLATDIVVIDDGSDPPVTYPGAGRVHIIRLPANLGITGALHSGVAHALREDYRYIARLDVGDVAWPERMARQYAHLEAHAHIALVGCRARVHAPDGRTIFHHGASGGPEAVASYLRRNAAFKHSSFLLRADALRQWGQYDCAYPVAQDYELALRLSLKASVDCLDAVLIDYEDNPNGISARRRHEQLRMRLKAQLAHHDRTLRSWLGIARTLITLGVPAGLAHRISRLAWNSAHAPAGS